MSNPEGPTPRNWNKKKKDVALSSGGLSLDSSDILLKVFLATCEAHFKNHSIPVPRISKELCEEIANFINQFESKKYKKIAKERGSNHYLTNSEKCPKEGTRVEPGSPICRECSSNRGSEWMSCGAYWLTHCIYNIQLNKQNDKTRH